MSKLYDVGAISIHALREEGDAGCGGELAVNVNISIHALREEGDGSEIVFTTDNDISIHALREEGDLLLLFAFCVIMISIHALREEGDIVHVVAQRVEDDFYPRPPRGGRHSPCSSPTG